MNTYNEITQGKWIYKNARVETEAGDVIAKAHREADCKIPAYQRDNNMKFIAAAPDMYEALKEIRDSVVCNGDFSHSYAIDGKIEALLNKALSKAEGKIQ